MLSRVALALKRPNLQRQLRQLLASDEVIVDILKGKQRMWERLPREICDLLLVSKARIPSPCEENIRLLCEVPDAPSVVVLLEQDDPELRAQLLAAGCQAVLDAEVSVEGLNDVLQTILEQRRELNQQRLAGAGVFTQPQLRDFVSNSPVMQAFLEVVERVVNSTISILILGETGVGKERLARAIHTDGPRSGGPLRGHQLRGAAGVPAGERALRPRGGRLHRRHAFAARAASSWPTAAPSFSTRSASCRCTCR